jgi:hypothetical protein
MAHLTGPSGQVCHSWTQHRPGTPRWIPPFFIVTAVKTSNLTDYSLLASLNSA